MEIRRAVKKQKWNKKMMNQNKVQIRLRIKEMKMKKKKEIKNKKVINKLKYKKMNRQT